MIQSHKFDFISSFFTGRHGIYLDHFCLKYGNNVNLSLETLLL